MVVEKDLAEISTIRKMVLEHDLTTERDVATEVVPFLQAETKRLFKSLDSKSIVNIYISRKAARGRAHPIQGCHALEILLCRLERSSRFVNFSSHLLH